MPSSNGGFGRKNQTNHAVIPSRARDLTHEARITQNNLCDPSPFGRSLTSFGMTRVFILRYSVTVIFPPTPRPLVLRSYIDCANTGGTMKSPRLLDLIW